VLRFNVHVPRPITRALRKLRVDVITAQEVGAARWSDPELLDRATALGRVLFSQDEDLLVEAARRQSQGVVFKGVIYAPQLALTTRQFIEQLELLAMAGVPADFSNAVQYLPLR
jgi:predicted nuclease of predicted toxin-antitoxin system